MFKRLLLGILLSTSISVTAQKRAVNWNFGDSAAISFTRSGVVNVSGSKLYASEGCASISDLSGNLQFYSNGINVWNADHSLMPNGTSLGSSGTPTQSVIIVPNPQYRHLYYIFTVDQNGGPSGLRYSEVDMSLENGRGNVTSNKSISLLGSCAEKITAIRNDDGTGVWVIAHGLNSNSFYAFLVGATGVQTSPVTSQVGSNHARQDLGQMKGSPDGKFIAIAASRTGRFVEILDFNATTGVIGSNDIVKVNYPGLEPYGVEFSADALKLYVSASNNGGEVTIYQYNMSIIFNEVLFNDTEFAIASNVRTRALQLGPDGKIYGASYNGTSSSNYLDVIVSPKLSGISCGFQSSGFTLAQGTGSLAGLPNFIVNYLIERKIEVSDSCVGDETQFVYLLEIPDSVRWNFDDPNSGNNNISTDLKPKHKFSNPGNYNVKLFVFNGTEVDTFVKPVTIHNYPNFTLGNDTTICKGQTLLLRPGIPYAQYLWQDGRKLSACAANATGLYHVRIEKNSCAAYDSIYVTVNIPSAKIQIENLKACENTNEVSVSLNHTHEIQSIKWNMGDGTSLSDSIVKYSYLNAGAYLVGLELINQFSCIARDTQTINILPLAKAQFSPISNAQCFNGHQVVFAENVVSGKDKLKNYRISTGDGTDFFNSGATHKYAQPGNYIAQLYTETFDGCLDTVSTLINIYKNPEANFTLIQKKHCEGSNFNEFKSDAESFNGSIKSSLLFTGDGRMFNVNSINYSYALSGDYIIKHRVIDSFGCMDETQKLITINEKPNVEFEVGNGGNCVGTDPIQFTNKSTAGNDNITSYDWIFGDGVTSQLENPSHQYLNADKYFVKLNVKSDKGCEASLTKEIFTYEVPKASFEIEALSVCFKENRLNFNNTSSIKGLDALTYLWSIDGAQYSDKSIIDYKFGSNGLKNISLLVKSDKGCQSLATKNIEILPSPNARLSLNTPIQCESSNLFVAKNESSISDRVVSWELSDGRSFGGNSISFSSSDVGVIKVELTIENDKGCQSKAITFVEVAADPVASFIADSVCLHQEMKFDNTSSLSSGVFAKVYWDYGDNHSNQVDFTSYHNYDEAGNYRVYLEVESDKGCRDIIVQDVVVKEIPEADFNFYKHGFENNKTVFSFEENVNEEYPNYRWFVNQSFSGEGQRFFYSFTDTGHYNVSLVVTNSEGCPAEISKDVFVVPPFQLFFPTAFTPNGDGKNDTYGPEPIEFVSEYDFVILNRWGTKVFSTRNTFRTWDGIFNGIPAENGSYVYLVKVKDVEGIEYTYQGNFLLIR